MTPKQRKLLDLLPVRRTMTAAESIALRAALADLDQVTAERDMTIAASRQLGDVYRQLKADLDACRAALREVAREVGKDGYSIHEFDLTQPARDAVLAAAGGDEL